LMNRERHLRVRPVHGARRREHEVLDAVVAAALEHRKGAGDVAVGIRERRLDAVAHAGLRREVHDPVEALLREQIRNAVAVADVELHELEVAVRLEQREPGVLQRDIVVLVQVVETDDLVAALEEPACRMEADKAGRTRHQNLQTCSLRSSAARVYPEAARSCSSRSRFLLGSVTSPPGTSYCDPHGSGQEAQLTLPGADGPRAARPPPPSAAQT